MLMKKAKNAPKRREKKFSRLRLCGLVAHTCNDNDDDKNPKNHIKIKITAAEVFISFTAITHCKFLLSMFCSIYYDYSVKFADCPHVLLEFFIEMGYNRNSDIFLGR